MQSRCPHCSTVADVDNSLAGRALTCEMCRRVYVAFPLQGERGLTLGGPQEEPTPGVRVPTGKTVRHVPGQSKLLDERTPVQVPGLEMELVPVHPGRFVRGSDRGYGNEAPKHIVTISDFFWMARYPVIQEQWLEIMHMNPSYYPGPQHPVETVSWFEAVEFCRRLTERERGARRLPANAFFRLPTEAEWEYVCRTIPLARNAPAGEGEWNHLVEGAEYCYGDNPAQLDAYAWFADNSGDATHPVGLRRANEWGVYDMHGNVAEWCMDWYDGYAAKELADPAGPPTGGRKVRRGGGWSSVATRCRAASRISVSPECACALVGFRVLLARSGDCPYDMTARLW